MTHASTILAMAIAAVFLASCAAGPVRTPVPAAMVDDVHPFGLTGLRDWGDVLSTEEAATLVATRAAALDARYGAALAAGESPRLEYLALSGGGQWGAFSAGILRAWSESGTRPEFLGVSGVSTGAIIAPFAFLGPEEDDTLLEIYSDYSTDDLLTSTVFSGLVSGTALADTTPLARVIARYVTPELVARIAAEHRKRRLLFIGTTNLDAGRPMIWNIGAIAASGEPGAVDLIRSLIRASAAIPVAFPPIFVEVETTDGEVFDEMHVDGGASSQVTFVSPTLPIAEATRAALGRNLDRRLWVIVNNDLEPPHSTVRPRLPDIGEAAVSSLIRGSGIGDVYRLYAISQRDEIDFRAAWIPPETPCPDPVEDFDRAFMACLYGFGRERFARGGLWRSTPPFFTLPTAKGRP